MARVQKSTCLGVAAVAAGTAASFGCMGRDFVAGRAAPSLQSATTPGAVPVVAPLSYGAVGMGVVALASGAAGSFGGKTKVKRAGVLLRAAPDTIAATAVANGNFKTLVAALQKAGLVDTLSGSAAFTVFAPTDAAFTSLLGELGLTAQQLLNSPDLKNILLHHVVSGTAMSASLRDGQKIGTVLGDDVVVKISGKTVKVSGAAVTLADVACSNGVIHVIDKVLMPKKEFDPAKQVGVTMPLGYFDPAGFCKKGDEVGFAKLRAAEIKHGRAAMMASVGAVAQHYLKFPGFESVPSGLQAVLVAPGTYGFAALFAISGVMELAIWTENPNKEPGNFGDPLGLNQYNAEMRDREINNGRMAMFAIFGIVAAEVLTGKDGIEQLGL